MVKTIPIDAEGVIIDGGANNGLFSFLMARRFPKARIIACEPSGKLIPILRRNFDQLNVDLVEKALSDTTGKLVLYTAGNSDQVGSIFKENVEVFSKIEINSVEVDAISLVELLKEKNILRISVLKLDVQGAEYAILKNAEDVLDITDYLLLELMFIEPTVFDLIKVVREKFPFYTVTNKVSYGADILFSKKELSKPNK
jgi:FkbM family methyltransferase